MALIPRLSRRFAISSSYFYNFFSPIYWKLKKNLSYRLIKKNKALKNFGLGKKVFIVGNAPSTKNIDFIKAQKMGDVFLCNKFFDSRQKVTPTCYFCVDGKIANGEWDLNLIDYVTSNYPNAKVFLNGKLDKKFINLFKLKKNVHWLMSTKLISDNPCPKIDITKDILGFNVAKIMLQVAIYMDYDEIYLCGIENNGFVYELQNINSHFYPGENESKDTEKDLWDVAFGYLGWKGMAKISRNVFNINKVGFLPWFPSKKIDIWKN